MEVVIDGQHRLNAILDSEKSVDMFVARNVPLDAFKYIDQGNTRTLKDVMDCAGWSDTATVSSAARYMWVYGETGTPFGSVRPENNLSAGSLFDWVDEYTPSIRDEWERNGELVRSARKGIKMSESIMFFLWMKFSATDIRMARQVYAYLADPFSGNGHLSKNFKYAVTMIADLQYEMKQLKDKGMKTRSDEHRDPCTKALIFAWNSSRKGKDYASLKAFKVAMAKTANQWEIQ
jgi:hypothetical protein